MLNITGGLFGVLLSSILPCIFVIIGRKIRDETISVFNYLLGKKPFWGSLKF